MVLIIKIPRPRSHKRYATNSSVPLLVSMNQQSTTSSDVMSQLLVKYHKGRGKGAIEVTKISNLREVACEIGMTGPELIRYLTTERGLSFLKEHDGFKGRVSIAKLDQAMRNILETHVICNRCCLPRHLRCQCRFKTTAIKTGEHCHCKSDNAEKQCSLITEGSRSHCCWCCDKRSNTEISDPLVYLDDIGYVRPKEFQFNWPIGATYCPVCSRSEPTACLYERLRAQIASLNTE